MVAKPEMCGCCEEALRKKGKPARPLTVVDITNTAVFKKKQIVSVKLCEFCDGDALALALLAHAPGP